MKRVLGAFIILLATVSCNNSSSQGKNNKFTDWAKKNSQKIETLELTEKQDDLKLLKQIVGKAEVVCLGESRHDIHEQFKLKHRFIKYLVEEMIKKREIYPDTKIKELAKRTKQSIEQVKKDLFGDLYNNDFSKQPFSKLKRDVAEQLGLI